MAEGTQTQAGATDGASQNDNAAFLQGIKDTVTQAVDAAVSAQVAAAVKPVADSVQGIKTEIDNLKSAQSQSGKKGSVLFGGGAPAVREGESRLSSRGYQFSTLFRALSTKDWSNAKVEQEVHDKLHDAYGAMSGEGNTILAPLGGVHLQRVDPELATEIRQMVRQGVAGCDFREMQTISAVPVVRQDLSTYDDTAGGVLLGSVQQGEMIDLLRAKEVFSRAGARDFTLPPNGRIQFPKKTGSSSGYWVGEKQEITKSSPTTGMLNMAAKKLGAIVDWPNELMRFTSASTEAMLRLDIAESMALKLDSSLLTALGSEVEPKGLINYSGLKTHTASVTGTNGDTLMPEDIAILLAKIEEAEIDTTNAVLLLRPLLHAGVTHRRADAVSANDGAGPYLLFKSTPDTIEGYRNVRSTQVPNNRVKGAGTDLTMLIAGVFSEFLIGRVGAMEFLANPFTDTNFKTDVTSIRAIQHVDGKPRREEAFGYIDNLLNL